MNKEEEVLNEKQELFCNYYVSEEFFANGVQAYLEVYDIDRTKPNWYKTACAAASQLLSNIKVCKRINELLDDAGLNDSFVDKQLLFVINQHEDLGAKMAAVREYNKLKKRVSDRLDITNHDIPAGLKEASIEELEAEQEKRKLLEDPDVQELIKRKQKA